MVPANVAALLGHRSFGVERQRVDWQRKDSKVLPRAADQRAQRQHIGRPADHRRLRWRSTDLSDSGVGHRQVSFQQLETVSADLHDNSRGGQMENCQRLFPYARRIEFGEEVIINERFIYEMHTELVWGSYFCTFKRYMVNMYIGQVVAVRIDDHGWFFRIFHQFCNKISFVYYYYSNHLHKMSTLCVILYLC